MKHPLKDINEMLDVLNLPLVSQRLTEIVNSPQISNTLRYSWSARYC